MEIVFYIFAIAATINSLYLLSYAFALFFLARPKNKKNDLPPISIIVAAKNEYKNLIRLIPLLLAQQYPKKEIIIVDDRSTDNTPILYDKYPDITWVKVTKHPKRYNGKKYAIESGINKASYERILLTDADCYPASINWAKQMSLAYGQKNEIVCGISLYEQKKGALNKFIQYETLITAIRYASFVLLKKPYMAVGRNLSYSKQLFQKNKFKGIEKLNGGDDDLLIQKIATKKNTTICLSPDSITYSVPKNSLNAYITQKRRHLHIGKYYKKNIRILLGIEALSSLLYYIFGIILLFSESYLVNTLAIFTARTLILFLIFIKFTKLIKHKKRLSLTLLEDIIYQIYNWFLGSVAFFRKTTRWK